MISTLKKKLNKKGFTLAELLVVVAIIAILVAIAIPVFGSQLNKAKAGTDLANLRSAYAAAQIEVLTNNAADKDSVQTAIDNALPSVTSAFDSSKKITAADGIVKTQTDGTKIIDTSKLTLNGETIDSLTAKAK